MVEPCAHMDSKTSILYYICTHDLHRVLLQPKQTSLVLLSASAAAGWRRGVCAGCPRMSSDEFLYCMYGKKRLLVF